MHSYRSNIDGQHQCYFVLRHIGYGIVHRRIIIEYGCFFDAGGNAETVSKFATSTEFVWRLEWPAECSPGRERLSNGCHLGAPASRRHE
jgi:hypothetical protein